jgi:hypothetical protein
MCGPRVRAGWPACWKDDAELRVFTTRSHLTERDQIAAIAEFRLFARSRAPPVFEPPNA